VQARQFHAAIGITGLVLTKLDGTARGWRGAGIASQLGLPIRYLGVGEGVDGPAPVRGAGIRRCAAESGSCDRRAG